MGEDFNEDKLNGRHPQWNITSMEEAGKQLNNFYWEKNTLETWKTALMLNDVKGILMVYSNRL